MRTIAAKPLSSIEPGWRQVVFSVSEARRALPYIARVIRDAAEAYHKAQRCRALLDGERLTPARAMLISQLDGALQMLNSATDECNAVGVDVRDLSKGSVAFRADLNGRQVSLLWRLGEPFERAWDDLPRS
jgi:hypothetical protein